MLAALSRKHHVPLVAVTDEPPERLSEFFARSPAALADNVVMDGGRLLFRRYEVTSLPTVVLLSADGSMLTRTTGYSPLHDFGLGGSDGR